MGNMRRVICLSQGGLCSLSAFTYLLGKKEVMFLVALVCLSVSEQHYSKGFERIVMKFHGDVGGSAKKKLIKS